MQNFSDFYDIKSEDKVLNIFEEIEYCNNSFCEMLKTEFENNSSIFDEFFVYINKNLYSNIVTKCLHYEKFNIEYNKEFEEIQTTYDDEKLKSVHLQILHSKYYHHYFTFIPQNLMYYNGLYSKDPIKMNEMGLFLEKTIHPSLKKIYLIGLKEGF